MSSLRTLARPYAKAAFELARDRDAMARWSGMLELAASIVADSGVAGLLESPHVSAREILALVSEAAGEAIDDRFRGFLGVLADNRRLALLPEIRGLYDHLRREAERRLHVRVVSAVALRDGQAERLRAALARRFDREVEMEFAIDAGILGGAVVYAGDQVIDGSLSGRLQKLQSRLAE